MDNCYIQVKYKYQQWIVLASLFIVSMTMLIQCFYTESNLEKIATLYISLGSLWVFIKLSSNLIKGIIFGEVVAIHRYFRDDYRFAPSDIYCITYTYVTIKTSESKKSFYIQNLKQKDNIILNLLHSKGLENGNGIINGIKLGEKCYESRESQNKAVSQQRKNHEIIIYFLLVVIILGFSIYLTELKNKGSIIEAISLLIFAVIVAIICSYHDKLKRK